MERIGAGMIVERIRAELDRIIDPCSAAAGAPAGLLEMGLVRELSVHQEPAGVAVRLRIGVTEPGCLMGASFAVQARQRLEHLDGVISVHIELDHRADWDPADIAPGYRLRLEAVREQRRQALRARTG
jgi:metal-sulfur cluster biosynthetic enzyme